MNPQDTPPSLPPRPAPTEVQEEKPGSLIGNKIKGIARIFHGAGEAIRGYSMSTLDNTISTKARGAAENGEITRRGQEEIERGMADLRPEKWKPQFSSTASRTSSTSSTSTSPPQAHT